MWKKKVLKDWNVSASKTEGVYNFCLNRDREEGKEEKESCPAMILKCVGFW